MTEQEVDAAVSAAVIAVGDAIASAFFDLTSGK